MWESNSQAFLDATVQPSEGVLVQELHGEMVLLDLNTGRYFGLDAVGSRIWELIRQLGRLRDIVLAITVEYDVEQEQCVSDLLSLLAKLEANGLVRVAGAQTGC